MKKNKVKATTEPVAVKVLNAKAPAEPIKVTVKVVDGAADKWRLKQASELIDLYRKDKL